MAAGDRSSTIDLNAHTAGPCTHPDSVRHALDRPDALSRIADARLVAEVSGLTRSRGPYAKSLQRRDAILDAALAVFAANGYQSGSLDEIATRVGITKPALRYYYSSKAALFADVLERRDSRAAAISRLVKEEDPIEALRGVVRLAAHNMSIPGVVALHTIVSAEAAVSDEHPAGDFTSRRYASLTELLTQILERCSARGLLVPHIEPARGARSIIAMWDGLPLQWLIDRDSFDLVGDLSAHIGGFLRPEAQWAEKPPLEAESPSTGA